MRKLMAILLVIVLEITCFTGCGNTKKTVAITPENYKEYFNIKLKCDSQMHESSADEAWFSYAVTATCRSTVTASFSHVELTGKVHLPVDQQSHPLYTENKLPLDITIVIDGTGFGEEQVYFQHGTGSYGGYSTGDFYFECTSASGYIELDGNYSNSTTEESSAIETTVLTPTPKPTTTPTPTPLIEKWVTDEAIMGTSWVTFKDSIMTILMFADDNTGFIITMIPVTDAKTKEESIRTTVVDFEYSIIGEGKIRFVYGEIKGSANSYSYADLGISYADCEYGFFQDYLQISSSDGESTAFYTRTAPW